MLRRNAGCSRDWRTRRLWPVFFEAVCSVSWAYVATTMVIFWCCSYAVGLHPLGANPVPNFWGMVIATVACVQLGVGVWLDRHYNHQIGRFYLWAAMYPLFYWMFMLVITVRATPRALIGGARRRRTGRPSGSPSATRTPSSSRVERPQGQFAPLRSNRTPSASGSAFVTGSSDPSRSSAGYGRSATS